MQSRAWRPRPTVVETSGIPGTGAAGTEATDARSRRPVPVDGRCPRPATPAAPAASARESGARRGPAPQLLHRVLWGADRGGRGRRKGNAGRGEHVPGKALTLCLTICA